MLVYYLEDNNEIVMLSTSDNHQEYLDRIKEIYQGKTVLSFSDSRSLEDIHRSNVISFYIDTNNGIPELIVIESLEIQPEPTDEDYLIDLDYRVSMIELGI